MKVLIIILLISLLFLFVGCESTPKREFGYFQIKGKSMNPALETPEVVLVKPVPFGHVEVGDIIVFEYSGRLIAHRTIRKTKNGNWVTMGDNTNREDAWPVTPNSYRGIAVQ
jgi:signal peptidase I